VIIRALSRDQLNRREWKLKVRTNIFSWKLGWGAALYVTALDPDFPGVVKYPTISGFLDQWEILSSEIRNIYVPFLKKRQLLGNVAGRLFARMGIYPTKDCGCPDRKEWWNNLVAFVPWSERRKAVQATGVTARQVE
jgi:hypothetical protein